MKVKKIAMIIGEMTNIDIMVRKRVVEVIEDEEHYVTIGIPEGEVDLVPYFEKAEIDIEHIKEEDWEVKYIDQWLWSGKRFEIPLIYAKYDVIEMKFEAEQKRNRHGKKLIDEIYSKIVLVTKNTE